MAQLDAGIILQGQPMNMLGILDASNRMAGEQKDRLHQQDYRNMLATNGAGIMAGDQNALNALAGFDPTAALGVQNTRQEMDFSRQRMGILNAQERRAAEEYAMGLSADQRAAEAKQIEDAVKMGLMIPDAATWDATMAQMAPDLVGQFDNRQALASRFMELSDVMKMAFPEPVDPTKGAPTNTYWNEPGNPAAGVTQIPGVASGGGFRPASPEEAARYGAAAGQFGPDGRFYPVNPPSGMSIETGPDGQLRVVQGPGAGSGGAGLGMKLTEQQAKDLTYWQRATGISDKLDQLGNALADFGDAAKGSVPFVGNAMVSAEYQQARQAGEEWLSAVLRKDTGAAITSQEMEIYGRTYLPQPGDGPEVLAQKQVARKRAEEGMRLGLGTAEILAQEVEARRAGAASPAPAPESAAVPGAADAAPTEIPQITDKASFDALPSGAEFIAPDGSRRRKP